MATEAVSAQPVQNAIGGLVMRENGLITSLSTVTSSISTAADYLTVLGDTEKVAAYKELMLSLGKLTHEIKTHQDALRELGTSYQASAEPTDFRAVLDAALADRLKRQPYEPRSDAAMREFVTGLGEDPDAVLAGGGAGGGPEAEDDDDVVEQGAGGRRNWTNTTCPLSLKNVLDLDHPVRDPVGYVFDREAVTDWLRRTRRPGLAPAQMQAHPVAGCSHFLREEQLVPAAEVVREQRRRRLQQLMGGGAGAAGGAGAGAAGEGEDDIIDV